MKQGTKALARWRVPLGWVLGLVALYLATPDPKLYVTGLGVAGLGEAIRLWAAGHLERWKGLTTSGPYAWTRNPLYLGSVLVGLGFALATGRWEILVLLALFLFLVYRPVMRREAAALAEAHPEPYAAYAEEVPLFLPRVTPYRGGVGRRFSWKRVWSNCEHVTVLGVSAVAALIGLKFWI